MFLLLKPLKTSYIWVVLSRAHNNVCGLSWITGSWFLESEPAVEFFKCCRTVPLFSDKYVQIQGQRKNMCYWCWGELSLIPWSRLAARSQHMPLLAQRTLMSERTVSDDVALWVMRMRLRVKRVNSLNDHRNITGKHYKRTVCLYDPITPPWLRVAINSLIVKVTLHASMQNRIKY